MILVLSPFGKKINYNIVPRLSDLIKIRYLEYIAAVVWYIHFVRFVEDSDHCVELPLIEVKLLQHMLDISSLSMELWVAQVSHIHKNILKERNQMNADCYIAGKFKYSFLSATLTPPGRVRSVMLIS